MSGAYPDDAVMLGILAALPDDGHGALAYLAMMLANVTRAAGFSDKTTIGAVKMALRQARGRQADD